MPSLAATHAEACASSGTSPPETWENKVKMWCQHCASVEELTHMVRAARGVEELAVAINVVRDRKGHGVALEVVKCL